MPIKLNRRQFGAAAIAAGVSTALPAPPAAAIGPFGKGLRTVKQVFGHSAVSLDQTRRDLGFNRPVALSQMAGRFVEDIVFDQPLNTSDGVALGGHHTLRIQRDGSYTYSGYFKATGLPSYDASVVTTLGYSVPNPSGPPMAAVAALMAKGRVHGKNEFGDDTLRWNQTGIVPVLATEWGNARRGKIQRDLQYSVNYFGTAGDVAGFIAKIAAAGLAFGSAGAGIVLLGEAASAVNIRGLAVPGIVGVIASGGAYYVLGPGMMIPAFVAGAGAAKADIRQDVLSVADIALGRKVFGGTIPYERIRKTNLLGVGDRPFTMVSPIDNTILLNLGHGFEDSSNYTGNGRSESSFGAPGQLLIHELTHAWQVERASWQPEFYCRALPDAIAKNYSYGPSGLPWREHGNEEQASIVEEWFAGSLGLEIARSKMANVNTHTSQQLDCPPMATESVKCGALGPAPNASNPYYRYIVENIRAGRN